MGAPLAPETTRVRKSSSLRDSWRAIRVMLVAALFIAGATLILLFPILPVRGPFDLQVGDVAPEDIRAPRQISYISQIETQRAREDAIRAVPDVYTPADPRLGRQQVRLARQIMDFVQDVRADSLADDDLKQEYLDQITALNVPGETRYTLLTLTDSEFDHVEREMVTLIEEAMSGTVREGRVAEITSRLELSVSSDVPESLIPVVVALAGDLVIPNSQLNSAATEAARQNASSDVPEIRHTFQAGEVVIRAGDLINETNREALIALGLASQGLTWRDIASALLVSLLAATVLTVYMVAFNPPWAMRSAYLLVVTVLFLLFLAAAQIMIPGRAVVAYLFPAAALALALSALLGLEFALLALMVLSGLVGFIADGSLEIAAFTATSGLFAAGSLQRGARLNNYFLSGIFAAIGAMGVLLAFRLPVQTESVQLAQLLLVSLLNGFFSAGLALVILFIVGNITGITTSIQLIDLMRPDHPLQKRMQQEALGSYQHTLSVANLVEAAAESIGANSLLARVGTLYHDVGKAANPGFFVENRNEGQPNPHEGLSPLASARIIRAHVPDGVRLARKHRLPQQIVSFIPEHHGTTPIIFFLSIAREQAAAAGVRLDESEFHYDGPLPQSRESAILMLADGCESAVRANRPATVEEIDAIVSRIIQQRIDQHQLDDSGLTLTDLKKIRESFVRTLKGMYHPRVKYPGDEKPILQQGVRPALGEGLPVEEAEPITPAPPTPESQATPFLGTARREPEDSADPKDDNQTPGAPTHSTE